MWAFSLYQVWGRKSYATLIMHAWTLSFNVNNGNTEKFVKTPDTRTTSDLIYLFIVNFEQISHIFLIFVL